MRKIKSLNSLSMIACAIIVGACVGFSVVLFLKLFAFVHNLFFLGQINFVYDEKIHTPVSLFGFGIIFVPVIGSFIVTWLIERFASNERGLSVPEVIYQIHFKEGLVRPSSAFAKTLASIISIGSGGSIGREGPIVQLSAAFSDIIGNLVHMPVRQKIVLIAAGAAAGMTIIFHAPIGSLAFVFEVLLVSFNASSISLIIVAEIIAILIGYYFLGDISLLTIPKLQFISYDSIFYKQLLMFIPFGIILGITSLVFIRGIYFTEDIFIRFFKNPYLRHAIGMFFVGIMFYGLMFFFDHYYIEGIGIATIQDVLNFVIKNPWLLFLIFILKLLATFLSLGSGASGGVFSPSLFIGAVLGSIWGIISNYFIINSDINLLSYIIGGMAGMLAGVTGGIITAIILCIEITNGYLHILPILITVVVAYVTRRIFCYETVYTLKLSRRNVNIHNRQY